MDNHPQSQPQMPRYESVAYDHLINGEIYYCFNQYGYYIGVFDHYSNKAKFKNVRFITNVITEIELIVISKSND